LPGFIAAVNKTATVSAGATEIYYMSYLYGFCASAVVFIVLHRIFPAPSLDAFVKNGMSATETRMFYREMWDDVGYEDEGVIEGTAKHVDMQVVVTDVEGKN
jgi:NCS1 family nucleobase:cation symporter-1